MTNRRGRGARWVLLGLGLLGLLASGLGGAPGAAAAPAGQPAGLVMTVRAGFEEHYKIGEWFPVQVTLSNTGQPFDAEVQVEALGNNDEPIAQYSRRVNLPAPSRKQVTLYTFTTSYQHQIRVRLLRGETVLVEQKTRIDPLDEVFLLGVVSDTPDLLNYLGGIQLGTQGMKVPAKVAHLTPDDLPPSTSALRGLDALVFANTDSSKLTPEQRRAIAGWVAEGGSLVVAGGVTGQATSAGLTDLLPVAWGGTRQVGDLAALGTYAGIPPPSGNTTASESQVRPDMDAATLIDVEGLPALVRRPLGSGEVFALALDPAQPPLDTWNKGSEFWKRIFSTHPVGASMTGALRTGNAFSGGYGYGSSYYYSQLSPFDLPSLELPRVELIAGFLFLYVVVVGPINYVILRRQRRQELAWITIPGIIVVFAVFAYLLGFGTKGSDLRLTTATLVRAYPNAPVATINSFVGLFSPTRETYALDFKEETQIGEISVSGLGGGVENSNAAIYQGKPSSIEKLTIDPWSMRGVLAESTVAYTSPYLSEFQLSGGKISGKLTNGGSAALTDVAVFSGNYVKTIGTLQPGESATVDLNTQGSSIYDLDTLLEKLVPGLQLSSYPPPSTAEDRARRRRAALLTTALSDPQKSSGSLNLWVVGWGGASPAEVLVQKRNPLHDDLVLIMSQLPVRQQPGQVLLGPGLIPRTVIKGQAAEESGPNGNAMRISGQVTFEYNLPPKINVTRLNIECVLDEQFNSYSSRLNTEIFNWQTNDWDDLNLGVGQSNGDLVSFQGGIPDPATHISADGRVQLRVAPTGTGQALIRQIDLSAEGEQR